MNNTNAIKSKLKKARDLYIKAQNAENEVFEAIIENFGYDILEAQVDNAINADNVGDMVSCFLNYGEGTADEIIKALKAEA